ncbi:unnamed protein product [Brassica oleracea var. botrytis]
MDKCSNLQLRLTKMSLLIIHLNLISFPQQCAIFTFLSV